MEPYQYEAIPYPDYLENTRVLTLAPGKASDPLSGTLATLNTTNPRPFEALSYVWGHHPTWETIACDGKAIRLTTTLAVALKRLRHEARHRVIWVDQICINQKDLIERNQQVKHMNSIYQKASKVLVWLGEDQGGHALQAFALMKSLVAISQDPLLLRKFKEKQSTLDWFPSEYWISLGELFKQGWFDRMWILQEIGTESPKELFWGEASLDWDSVYKVAVLIRDHGYLLRRIFDLLVWKVLYMDGLFAPSSYKSKALNFTLELHRARWQFSNDARDHIFALLGHPSAPKDEWVIEADYTKPVEKVFHDLAVRMLRKGDSLMILNVVQHDSIEFAARRQSLPTWVPQWDCQSSLHNLLGDDTCAYRPSKDFRPAPKFLEYDQVLVMDGLTIDTISTTSGVLHTSDIVLGSSTIANLWICQPQYEGEGFSTAKKYPTGEPALFAFLETFSAIKKLKQQASTPESERLSDGANFLVKAFDGKHIIGDNVCEMSRSGDCSRWMEKASGGANGRKFARCRDGYFALCPPTAREGDKLCLLLGGQTLFCLRPNGDSYLFVGECYVHGVMYGEALDMLENGQMTQMTFMIR